MRSYFQSPVKLETKTAKLVSEINSIEHIEVGAEIEALLLEAKLIRKLLPPYNIDLRDDKSPYYIHLTSEEYPRPIINHIKNKSIAGPFLNRHVPSKILRQFRKIAPYCTAPRNSQKPCFHSHLGTCSPCPATKDQIGYQKNITKLKSLLRGNLKPVKASLISQMDLLSSSQNYEQAARIRDQIKNLDYLLTPSVPVDEYIVNPNLISDLREQSIQSLKFVLNLESLARIEFYDNAHLQGTAPTSAMTVAVNGEIMPRLYRHFTLHTKDDVSMMREVLTRRLKHVDWPTPDLIVLDGGLPQLSIVNWDIPTVGLAKKEEILYTKTGQIKLSKDNPGLKLIMRLRDGAHRFSRRLHHLHRSKKLLN